MQERSSEDVLHRNSIWHLSPNLFASRVESKESSEPLSAFFYAIGTSTSATDRPLDVQGWKIFVDASASAATAEGMERYTGILRVLRENGALLSSTLSVGQAKRISVEEIAQVIKDIHAKIKLGHEGLAAVNAMLQSGFSIADLPTEKLLAILRGTFIWRKQMSFWKTFLEKTRQELNSRNLLADQLLQGLDRD